MIYIDASQALARLLLENKRPPEALWDGDLISSQLLRYEIRTRLNAHDLGASLGFLVEAMLNKITLVEMTPSVLARALKPYPVTLRTLDALHMATLIWLIGEQTPVRLASYDRRMIACAEALGVEMYPH